MSDKLVLAGNSISNNAIPVERKCLTDYRDPDECLPKQQMGNSIYEGDQRDESERTLGVQSAGRFGDSGLDSAAPPPYLANVCEAVGLIFKVFAASPADSKSQTAQYQKGPGCKLFVRDNRSQRLNLSDDTAVFRLRNIKVQTLRDVIGKPFTAFRAT